MQLVIEKSPSSIVKLYKRGDIKLESVGTILKSILNAYKIKCQKLVINKKIIKVQTFKVTVLGGCRPIKNVFFLFVCFYWYENFQIWTSLELLKWLDLIER